VFGGMMIYFDINVLFLSIDDVGLVVSNIIVIF